MKVLMVEGAPGVGAAAATQLREAGHDVVGCEAADRSSPCRGLEPVADCPLDHGHVDVAVVSRAGGDLAPSERGALCAARHRVPVVLAGNPRHAVSFGPGTHLAGADLLATCEHASRSGVAHIAAIRRSLLLSGVLTADDVDDPSPGVVFEVRREPGRLRLTVRTRADDPRVAAITKASAEALRRFDDHTPVIDVVAAVI